MLEQASKNSSNLNNNNQNHNNDTNNTFKVGELKTSQAKLRSFKNKHTAAEYTTNSV